MKTFQSQLARLQLPNAYLARVKDGKMPPVSTGGMFVADCHGKCHVGSPPSAAIRCGATRRHHNTIFNRDAFQFILRAITLKLLKNRCARRRPKPRLGKLELHRAWCHRNACVFIVPVGTQASVKALDPARTQRDAHADHSRQHVSSESAPRPSMSSAPLVALHKFINWEKPILTDSGGFQVFSLAKIRKVKEHGVEFRSHLDGSLLFIGPKESMEIQRVLGSDIAMVFDECPPHDAPAKEQRLAVERTIRWARECAAKATARRQPESFRHRAGQQRRCAARAMHQGARRRWNLTVTPSAASAWASPEPEMMRAIELAEPHLPTHKARYAIWASARPRADDRADRARRVDMFDCVLPTRIARTGTAVTHTEARSASRARVTKRISARSRKAAECYACRTFTRAYLRHLLRANEITRPAHGERPQLASLFESDDRSARGDRGGDVRGLLP